VAFALESTLHADAGLTVELGQQCLRAMDDFVEEQWTLMGKDLAEAGSLNMDYVGNNAVQGRRYDLR
jgi:hypothetical protein